MSSFRETLIDQSERLCWGLWTELGVPGVVHDQADRTVDLETLVVFTATLASRDPRLLGLAIDWCAAHHDLVSASRVRGLARNQRDEVRRAYDAFAHRVNEDKPRALPLIGNAPPLSCPSSNKNFRLQLKRPSLVRVRFASIFGPSIKAGILAELLASAQELSTTELADALFYQRRPVAIAIDALVAAGVIDEVKAPGRVRYRLASPKGLTAFAGATATEHVRWPLVFAILADLLSFANTYEDNDSVSAVVAMNKLLTTHDSRFKLLHVKAPEWTGDKDADARNFRAFAPRFAAQFASPNTASISLNG